MFSHSIVYGTVLQYSFDISSSSSFSVSEKGCLLICNTIFLLPLPLPFPLFSFFFFLSRIVRSLILWKTNYGVCTVHTHTQFIHEAWLLLLEREVPFSCSPGLTGKTISKLLLLLPYTMFYSSSCSFSCCSGGSCGRGSDATTVRGNWKYERRRRRENATHLNCVCLSVCLCVMCLPWLANIFKFRVVQQHLLAHSFGLYLEEGKNGRRKRGKERLCFNFQPEVSLPILPVCLPVTAVYFSFI